MASGLKYFGKQHNMRLTQYLNESKVWLDDVRKAPSGWIHFEEIESLKSYYKKHHKNIKEMSLDHDLGDNIPPGYEFLLWLEEMVYTGKYTKVPVIRVHSANPVGKRRMEQSIKSINKRINK